MIEITGVDLVVLVKEVYNMSVPQGLGFLHFTQDTLTDEEASTLINEEISDGRIVDMDYVKGRSCKFIVKKENGKLTIPDTWYDHTDNQLNLLLVTVLPDKNWNIDNKEHSVACNCSACIVKRGKRC